MPSQNINYLKIVHNAWRITWKHKYLWWFGFFASAMNVGNAFFYIFVGGKEENKDLDQKINSLAKQPEWIAIAILALLIFYLAFFLIQALAQGSLLASIGKISRKEPANFKTALRDGKTYFWKVFLIRLLIGLSMFCVGVLLFTPVIILLYLNANFVAILLIFLALFILIPISFLALFLEIYSLIYAVLGNLSLRYSVENAYLILRKNLTPSLIMALISIVANSLMGIVFIMVSIPFLIFAFLAGVILSFIFNETGAILTIITIFITISILLIFLRAIYGVFNQSLWILFFEEIGSPKSDKEPGEPVEEEIKIKATPKTDPVEGM